MELGVSEAYVVSSVRIQRLVFSVTGGMPCSSRGTVGLFLMQKLYTQH